MRGAKSVTELRELLGALGRRERSLELVCQEFADAVSQVSTAIFIDVYLGVGEHIWRWFEGDPHQGS